MSISKLDKAQAVAVVKAAVYVGISAALDYVISVTQGTEFGVLTPVINIVLVTVKKLFTPVEE